MGKEGKKNAILFDLVYLWEGKLSMAGSHGFGPPKGIRGHDPVLRRRLDSACVGGWVLTIMCDNPHFAPTRLASLCAAVFAHTRGTHTLVV